MSVRASQRRVSEERERCPSCGREVTALATDQCMYCLGPLRTAVGSVDSAKIVPLFELDRARRKARRGRRGRGLKSAGSGLLWVILGLGLAALFSVSARWLAAFFGRGVLHP